MLRAVGADNPGGSFPRDAVTGVIRAPIRANGPFPKSLSDVVVVFIAMEK